MRDIVCGLPGSLQVLAVRPTGLVDGLEELHVLVELDSAVVGSPLPGFLYLLLELLDLLLDLLGLDVG